MKQVRLPPQPTDTALARLVRRMIDRIPAVSIGRHRKLEKREHETWLKLTQLRHQYIDLERHCDQLFEDLKEIAADFAPNYDVKVSMYRDDASTELHVRTAVDFQRVNYEWRLPRKLERDMNPKELRGYTSDAMRRAAREIADRHCAELELAIFDQSLRNLGRIAKADWVPNPPFPRLITTLTRGAKNG